MDGFNKIDRDQIRSAAEYVEECMRHDAGPFAVPQVGTNAKKRITHDLGLDRYADRSSEVVDDAAVLHVFAENTQAMGRSLPPSDRSSHGLGVVATGDEDIALPIER